MELQNIGFWISPSGKEYDVYSSPEKTHEGVARRLSDGDNLHLKDCTAYLLKKGWIRISIGTVFNVFHLRRKERNLIRQFLEARQSLYKETTIELQEYKRTRMLPVEYFLKKE